MPERITHAFDPVLDRRSRVLILGTMPSPASRKQGFYYSHPRNRFWPVLAEVFGGSVPRTPAEKRAFALEHRIALWDVLHSCEIEGASDASIRKPEPNDIPALLDGTEIIVVCTTGAAAAALYRRYFGRLEIRHIALPSTSPANCRAGMAELTAAYAILRELTADGCE